MPEAVIVDAVRTPIGRHNGALKDVRPDDLAALVVREVVRRAGVDPALVEEVYLGCANQAGEDNRNVGRMAALLAGFPVSVAGVTFNRICSSGLAAVNAAARGIKVGEGEVFVAGGVESMTRAPYAIPKNLDGAMGNVTAWDTTLGWRFPNPRLKAQYGNDSMGETAENLRERDPKTSREDQDRFALESHRRAVAGVEPRTMGLGPVPATRKALARAGLRIEDVGLIELNEAFAVQALMVIQTLGFRPEITNVNGGAIALGHPLGCSGARIMCTLVHEMRRRSAEEKRPYYGLATLCVGVGQGEATVVEWVGEDGARKRVTH